MLLGGQCVSHKGEAPQDHEGVAHQQVRQVIGKEIQFRVKEETRHRPHTIQQPYAVLPKDLVNIQPNTDVLAYQPHTHRHNNTDDNAGGVQLAAEFFVALEGADHEDQAADGGDVSQAVHQHPQGYPRQGEEDGPRDSRRKVAGNGLLLRAGSLAHLLQAPGTDGVELAAHIKEGGIRRAAAFAAGGHAVGGQPPHHIVIEGQKGLGGDIPFFINGDLGHQQLAVVAAPGAEGVLCGVVRQPLIGLLAHIRPGTGGPHHHIVAPGLGIEIGYHGKPAVIAAQHAVLPPQAHSGGVSGLYQFMLHRKHTSHHSVDLNISIKPRSLEVKL